MTEVVRVKTPARVIAHWERLGILQRLYLTEPEFTYGVSTGPVGFVEGPRQAIQTLVDQARNNCAPWCEISGTLRDAFGKFLVNARERMQ
jgi:hypothetical protein